MIYRTALEKAITAFYDCPTGSTDSMEAAITTYLAAITSDGAKEIRQWRGDRGALDWTGWFDGEPTQADKNSYSRIRYRTLYTAPVPEVATQSAREAFLDLIADAHTWEEIQDEGTVFYNLGSTYRSLEPLCNALGIKAAYGETLADAIDKMIHASPVQGGGESA